MFRILVYIFLAYLAYRFIFNFLIPVYKTTEKIKKGFREMNGHMDDSANPQQHSSSPHRPQTNKTSKEPVGDYIDFEEIK